MLIKNKEAVIITFESIIIKFVLLCNECTVFWRMPRATINFFLRLRIRLIELGTNNFVRFHSV